LDPIIRLILTYSFTDSARWVRCKVFFASASLCAFNCHRLFFSNQCASGRYDILM